jgi:hypothetical protein
MRDQELGPHRRAPDHHPGKNTMNLSPSASRPALRLIGITAAPATISATGLTTRASAPDREAPQRAGQLDPVIGQWLSPSLQRPGQHHLPSRSRSGRPGPGRPALDDARQPGHALPRPRHQPGRALPAQRCRRRRRSSRDVEYMAGRQAAVRDRTLAPDGVSSQRHGTDGRLDTKPVSNMVVVPFTIAR